MTWGPHANLKMNEDLASNKQGRQRPEWRHGAVSEMLSRDQAIRKGVSTKFGDNGAFVHSRFVQMFCEHLCFIKPAGSFGMWLGTKKPDSAFRSV